MLLLCARCRLEFEYRDLIEVVVGQDFLLYCKKCEKEAK